MTAFACFVCCIIWLIRSSCCFVKPSFPGEFPLKLAIMAGELGAAGDDEDDDEDAEENDEEDRLLCPSPLKGTKVAPWGELASPITNERPTVQLVSDSVFFTSDITISRGWR